MPITRTPINLPASIAINTAISNVIPMGDFSGGLVVTPAAWDAAAIAFKVCDTPGGTFVPLRSQTGAIVEITNIVTSAACAYPLPDELFGALFFQIWSESTGAGTDTNQTASRSLIVTLKG